MTRKPSKIIDMSHAEKRVRFQFMIDTQPASTIGKLPLLADYHLDGYNLLADMSHE